MMGLDLSPEQKQRYLMDAVFHARVEVVSRALWAAVSHFDFGHLRTYPYDRLADVTMADLVAYAIAAVEALEACDASLGFSSSSVSHTESEG